MMALSVGIVYMASQPGKSAEKNNWEVSNVQEVIIKIGCFVWKVNSKSVNYVIIFTPVM